ncbi:MAG: tetratricopeptide repeat protein [Chthoniobacterales bacterium]
MPTPAPREQTNVSLSDEGATQAAIRFYLARVERDPEDARSQNTLAEYYLQEVRESGNEDYLPRALAAARASVDAVGPERNVGGLTALVHAEFSNHDFAAARDHAIALITVNSGKSEPFAILGDAQLELGDYDAATKAFAEMERLSPGDSGTHTRLARAAFLRGKPDEATAHLLQALDLLLGQPDAPREAVAWCRWQLGEIAFSTGDDQKAERFYREALADSPNSFRALAALGRVRAGRGDLPGAITLYEQAVRMAPDVNSMAALGDLFTQAGRLADAAVRFELVEQLGEHSRKVHNSPFNRNLALFYADHDLKPGEAYTLAQGEYSAGRHDGYGADALAWTALKSGRIAEAESAMKEALRLGTLDARFFYHAGMIARGAGDNATAVEFLKHALTLNPHFDLLQSKLAREALEGLAR